MTEITLPSGKTAVLRDPKTVTERLRRPVQNAHAKWTSTETFKTMVVLSRAKKKDSDLTIPDEDMALLDRLNDVTAVALVESWSYEFPVSIDTLQDITGPDYDVLRTETAKSFSDLVTSFAPTPDPASPTEPSNA